MKIEVYTLTDGWQEIPLKEFCEYHACTAEQYRRIRNSRKKHPKKFWKKLAFETLKYIESL